MREKKLKTVALSFVVIIFLMQNSFLYAGNIHAKSKKYASKTNSNLYNKLNRLTGNRDTVLVAAPDGRIIYSKNADVLLVPASILKIITSLAAFHYLGDDYRFCTEFYIDKNLNMKVKGYGDPLLVSETLFEVSKEVAKRINKINDLVVDNSFFDDPITIPGITSSSEPYDAPNSALSSNFNTVCFKTKKGSYISAESQTPLLPFVMKRIKKSSMKRGRIPLSSENNETSLYTGHLLKYYFKGGKQLHGQR